MPETSLDDAEIVASGPRYAFGVCPGGWGVWDRRRPDVPVALFAETDEGMDQAERVFEGLDREDRRARGAWSKPLLIVMFVSLGVWVLARALAAVLLSLVYGRASFESTTLVRAAQVVDVSSGFFFALWIAALVVFVTLWLQRNRFAIDRLTTPAGSTDERLVAPAGSGAPARIDADAALPPGPPEPPRPPDPNEWARPTDPP